MVTSSANGLLSCPVLLRQAHAWMVRRLETSPTHRWGGWLFEVWKSPDVLRALGNALRSPGGHRLSPVGVVETAQGERLECWEAIDALVLKALALLLTPFLTRHLSPRCFHLPGRGGAKGAVRGVCEALRSGRYPFVARSDARGYYANIRHATLLGEVRRFISCPILLDLVCQYCHRTIVFRGLYRRVDKGISLGCPLSPLMAAVYLDRLDRRLENLPGVFYVRFMDDWIILAESRWKLRRAVRIMNETLEELSLEQHPDKTFIGRVAQGFDFLGYQFAANGALTASRVSVGRFAQKIARLYEQGAGAVRIGRYTQNWFRWLHAGLGPLSVIRSPLGRLEGWIPKLSLTGGIASGKTAAYEYEQQPPESTEHKNQRSSRPEGRGSRSCLPRCSADGGGGGGADLAFR
ncbi:MAG: RNA-directed DNA polymerase [Verrucomicrobiales bacterium]|jgi:RNA-directed DNA polymerase